MTPSMVSLTNVEGNRVALLEAYNLSCERGDRLLFEHLGFSLEPGAMVQIEGHNGAGKTSLLRILCGLAQPSAGVVRWRGRDIHCQRQEFLSEVLYLGHHHGVKGLFTPEENLKISIGLGVAHPTLSIREALIQVGLDKFHDYPCQSLSAGQRRRVALARLLTTQTNLWILDEPFTSLDRSGVRMVEVMLRAHLATGGAAVITTHHPVKMDDYPVQKVNLDY
ncbi:cytochrome c maturation protein A [Gammaproteobacteria bacterium]